MAERQRAGDVRGGEIVPGRPWQRLVFGAGVAAIVLLGAALST